VERTKALIYVLDGSITDHLPPSIALLNLRRELDLYYPGLASRPSLIFLSKADVFMSDGSVRGGDGSSSSGSSNSSSSSSENSNRWQEEEEAVRGVAEGASVIIGSATSGMGLEELAVSLRKLVESIPTPSPSIKEGVITESEIFKKMMKKKM